MTLRELHVRYSPTACRLDGRRPLTTPRDVAAYARELLDTEPGEVFGVLLLTTKQRVIAWHVIGRGSLSAVIVEPRDVIRAALLANAAAVIAVHNHPSGDPTPSPDDINTTRRLTAAGALMGIDVLDHIIVGCGTGRYSSFKEMGTL